MRSGIRFWFLAGLFFAGCVKTDNTSTTSVTLQLKALASPVQGSTIEWTAGTAAVVSVMIVAKRDDNSEIEFRSVADTLINLFAPVAVGTITLPAGKYRQLEFRSQLDRRNMHPALRLEGTYTGGGAAIPVILEVSTPVEIKAKKDTVTLANGALYTGLTTIDFSQLIKGIAESDLKAADKPTGTIILSTSSNPGIYSKMLLNLEKSIGIDLR